MNSIIARGHHYVLGGRGKEELFDLVADRDLAGANRRVRFRFIDPDAMLGSGELGSVPALAEVAKDARVRLERVATALRS